IQLAHMFVDTNNLIKSKEPPERGPRKPLEVLDRTWGEKLPRISRIFWLRKLNKMKRQINTDKHRSVFICTNKPKVLRNLARIFLRVPRSSGTPRAGRQTRRARWKRALPGRLRLCRGFSLDAMNRAPGRKWLFATFMLLAVTLGIGQCRDAKLPRSPSDVLVIHDSVPGPLPSGLVGGNDILVSLVQFAITVDVVSLAAYESGDGSR